MQNRFRFFSFLVLGLLISPSSSLAEVFSYKAPPGTRTVFLAGTFNGWSSTAAPMSDPDGDGIWKIDIAIPSGTHQYKFVVNAMDWKMDPENPRKVDDGLGGQSSIIDVVASPSAASASAAAPRSSGTVFSVDAPGAQKVDVMGSWNNWTTPTLLTRGADGKWTVTMNLAPGAYEYKFRKNEDWDALNPGENRKITVAAGAAAAPVAAAVASAPAAAVSGGTVFSVDAPGAQKVDVMGSWNNWTTPTLLTRGADGKYTVTMNLAPGNYEYKFRKNEDWDALNPGENRKITVAAGAAAAPVAAAVASTPAAAVSGGTVFSVDAPGAQKVDVMGSWNNWTTPTLLTRGADGKYTVTMNLAPGNYEYKFRKNEDWDALNPGENRKITVAAGAAAAPAAAAVSQPTGVAPAAGAPTFWFRAVPGIRSVSVAGSFNNWSATATPMSDEDRDGIWTSHAQLPAGKHQYQFVIDGTRWILDPENGKKVENSVIEIGTAAPGAATAPSASRSTFSYKAAPGTRSVSVAGSFNSWSATATPMADADGDGVWTTDIKLPPGTHQYKFVINGSDWKNDPENPNKTNDGQDGQNSVLEVSASSRSSPEPAATARASPSLDRDLWAPEEIHRFSYRAPEGASSVAVAGNFNNWSTTMTPMSDSDRDGIWTLEFTPPKGKTLYKFVVNGNQWNPDPDNPQREAPDNNSVLLKSGLNTPPVESHRGDGVINLDAIEHRPDGRYITRVGDTRAVATLRLDRNDVDLVSIVIAAARTPLLPLTFDAQYEYFRIAVDVPRETFAYTFEIIDGDRRFTVDRGLPSLPFELGMDVYRTPEWIKSAVIYQIFPDRFANGNTGNDPAGVKPWRYEALPSSSEGWEARYGGDLDGIGDHFDYLADLGVTAVKLNPIFEAPSNIKYDATDYYSLSKDLGTEEGLKGIIAHESIKIIVDGVFNHSGEHHPYFEDVKAKGPASPYYKWYNILKWPFPAQLEASGPNAPSNYYECWWGFGGLPAWNTTDSEVRDYLYGAVTKWSKLGVAGWRLDAANEVDDEFWRGFRKIVKSVNPDAWVAAEIWNSDMKWFGGDQFDATTNYELRGAILDFFVDEKVDAERFANRVAELSVNVPPQVHEVQYNHISSHDVPRLLTLAGGNASKAMQAAAFQFSVAGVPVIYYGEEIGMEGGKDPDNRRAFPWPDDSVQNNREIWNSELLAHYKKLIALRKKHPALRASRWWPLHAQGKTLVVATENEGEKMILAFNASDEPFEISFEVAEPGMYKDILGDANCMFLENTKVTLGPRQSSYFVKEER